MIRCALSVLFLIVSIGSAETIQVREDRSRRNGRTIDVHVEILRATGTPARDALFIFQGGPGQSATQLADFYGRTFARARESRDLVLVDVRGTGKSNPLPCDVGVEPGELFPLSAVARCRDELTKRVDLTKYTTADIVQDVEEIRAKLGYEQLDLYGTSYGTRVALEYLRRYPSRVRAMIVKGVVAPSMRYTVDPALDTQRSMDKVIALAPSLREDLDKLFASLPIRGVTRDDVAVELRGLLHSVPGIQRLPALVRDPNALVDGIPDHRHALSRELSLGMYFSVTCAEDAWRVSDADAKRETANTFPRNYWHRQLTRACTIWPHAKPRREIAKPVRAKAPVLIISGGYDPVTPPRFGEEIARTLSNSRHLIIPNGSHSFAGMTGCVDVAMNAFLLDPDPKKVDGSCVEKIPPPL
ncbi:MAG TPA: alpha/beta fold hydrolase [Thermoanaerobaculia bacterium]|nr:alpha/beta fold hydrolase [Thermoanaerobaculia bacterium]